MGEENRYMCPKATIIELYGTASKKWNVYLSRIQLMQETRPSLILQEIRPLRAGMTGANAKNMEKIVLL